MDSSHSPAPELTRPPQSGSDSSVPQRHLSPRRRYATKEWEAMKPFIKKSYIDNNETLSKLMKRLAEERDFHPTPKMLKDKFSLWNFAKNITDKNARRLLYQKTVSDATHVSTLGIHGRPINERRLRRYLKRKRRTSANSMPSMKDRFTSDSVSITSTSHETFHAFLGANTNPQELQPEDHSYEQDCPYRLWKKKFRFSETYPDGTTNQRDSFGYGLYVNTDEERPCTSDCFCRKHRLQEAFTFEAHKSLGQLHITIYSDSLYDQLAAHIPLENVVPRLGCPKRTVNGLALLKCYNILITRLRDLCATFCNSPANQLLALEIDLLVNGFLGDGQVFESFGYESIYELGFLDYPLWKHFQQQKLDKDITMLDDGFCAIDNESSPTLISELESTTLPENPGANGLAQDLTEPLLEIENEIEGSSSQAAGIGSAEVHVSNNLHVKDARDAQGQLHTNTTSDFGKPLVALHQQNEITLALLLDLNLSEGCAEKDLWKSDKGTSFLAAALKGGERTVQYLFGRGAVVSLRWRDILLEGAARAGHEAIVKLLLDHGADVNRTTLCGETPLGQAARAGYKGIVQLLLNYRADVNGTGRHGETPLWRAVQAGHEGIVQLLLNYRADMNRTGRYRETPLCRAVEEGHGGIVQLLLDHGADVNGTGQYGETPLCRAVDAGHEGIVQLLLDYGADVNGTGRYRETPLCRAVEEGHGGIVQLLLNYRADVNGTGQYGETLLCRAVEAGHEGIVQLLLDHGADVNSTGWCGETPLWQAVQAGHEGIVQLLLNYRADVNGTGQYGETPLWQAVQAGYEVTVQLLLDYGADVNGIGQYGETLLCRAVEEGHEGIVQLLLDYGADVNSIGWCGETPLWQAERAGHERIVQLLLYYTNTNDMGLALSIAATERKVDRVSQLIRLGADVQLAALYLQGRDRHSVQWLLRIASATSSPMYASKKKQWQRTDSDASENLRYLRLKFVGQYILMTKAARDSHTKLRDLPQQFRSYREAWIAGIETMRRLCRGDTPREVHGILAFLSLGRSIVETLRDRKNCDYIEKFQQDLDRWEMLFNETADIEAFRDALKSMWGIMFDEYTQRESVDEDILFRFQELASILVSRANDLLSIDVNYDRGVESRQQNWSETGKTHINDASNGFSEHQIIARVSSSADPEVTLPQLSSVSTLQESIKADTSPFEPIAILLIAGAIFTIVIIFLQILRQTFTRFSSPQIGALQVRYWILAEYVGLGETGVQALWQIRQEGDLRTGYSISVC